jgi:ubiquinone/menaquinone biosynthesis C-methylase UbiE
MLAWQAPSMTRFDTPPVTPDHISYLDAAAATDAARDIKERLLVGLDIREGQVVVDVGCGPGTDLRSLADAVGPTGSVLGIDVDPDMVKQARHRLADLGQADVQRGDAYSLPLRDASVDRARVDRVLQHLDNPAAALAELRRVLRVGGRLGLAEPDWDTLAIDDVDLETSRTFARYVCDKTRHGTVGRQLTRLAAAAGFTIVALEAHCVVFRDFANADRLLGLERNAVRAVRAGQLSETAAIGWLQRLAIGEFLASFTFFTLVLLR